MHELLIGFEVVFERDKIDDYREVLSCYGGCEPINDFLDNGECKVSLKYNRTIGSFYMNYVSSSYVSGNNQTRGLSPKRLGVYLELLRKRIQDIENYLKVDMSYLLDKLRDELHKELRELEISKQMLSGNGMIMDRDTKEAFEESGRLASVRIPQLRFAIQLIKNRKTEYDGE